MNDVLLISDLLLMVLALIWITIAVFTDIKTKEVPNWVSFSLLAFAVVIRALAALISKQANYFIFGLVIFAIFFFLTNLLYKARAFGGGDAKLLLALSVVFATNPLFINYQSENLITNSFLLNYTVNIFFIGAIYGFFFTVISAVKYKDKFKREFKKINKNPKIKITHTISLALAFLFLILTFTVSKMFILITVLFLLISYLYSFIIAVEKTTMIKSVKTRDLIEGDWIAHKLKLKKITIKPTADGLTKQQIKIIQKEKKKIDIKTGLPFIPVFFIALVLTIFIGNLLFKLMAGLI